MQGGLEAIIDMQQPFITAKCIARFKVHNYNLSLIGVINQMI